jgi:hypothetical protein
MFWIGLIIGGGGFILSHRFRERVDRALGLAWASAWQRLRAALSSPPTADDDLELTGRLISSLQAGISLDAALDALALEAAGTQRARLRALLDGRPPPDFLSAFLRTALDTGMPSLAALQSMERALRSRRRLALRAVAVSGNCRAQAEVLSWLPWVLGGAIALLDHDWFLSATRQPISWLLWAVAVLLAGFGRGWIKRSVTRALSPKAGTETLEERILPDFVLRVIAEVSQGIDVESATERSLLATKDPLLSRAFAENSGGTRAARLRNLLRHAARTGAPVRDELGAFLEDLRADTEARWEERVQRLPIALLGPLFACFFPSSILILLALLVPIFRVGL